MAPRRDPGGVWALRESVWNAAREERRKRILEGLREAFSDGEHSLCGWPAICEWLNAHGFRNRFGGAVTPVAAIRWRKILSMPVIRGRPGKTGQWCASLPWTSNYLLLAWAGSIYMSG